MFAASRLSILFLLLAGNLVATSSAQKADSTAAAPAADPVDVESVDAIIAAVYDVISGPVGEARDWDRFRSLFLPGANLVPVFQNEQGGVQSMELTPEDYIRRSGEQLVAVGFTESEIFRVEERFGNLVHAFSTYEGFRSEDMATPFVRGINSIQVLFKEGRWWIANLAWQPEQVAAGIELPDKYMPDRN